MITDGHVAAYINSLESELPEYLAELEEKAHLTGVPIIRKEAQSLLRFLIKLYNPEKILEIGTAVGFSALLMSECMSERCTLTTVEKVKMRIVEAEKNLPLSPAADRISFIKGDAADVLKDLTPYYDFIFLDAAKAQYMNFLPDILRILKPGGLLITDNVLQEGSIAMSKYSIERRDRTIHMRMREYLYELKHNQLLETTILAVGDGMALSLKKNNYD